MERKLEPKEFTLHNKRHGERGNLHYTIKNTKNAGRRGRSLSKVNRLHLAPKSLPTPLPQFVPAAAAELQALAFTPYTDPCASIFCNFGYYAYFVVLLRNASV